MEHTLPVSRKINVNCLINGYSRKHIGKLSNNKYLASSIIDVIKYYYPKINGYSFIWRINNSTNIQQIINSSSKQTFDSDVFDCGLSNKFFLQIQPNTNSSQFSSTKSIDDDWDNTAPPHNALRGPLPRFRGGSRRSQSNTDRNPSRFGYRNIVTINDNPTDNNTHNATNTDEHKHISTSCNRNIILNLMSFPLPPKYKYVVFQCELYFHEIHMEYSTIWSIKNENNKAQHPYAYGHSGYSHTDCDDEKKDDNTYTKFGWVIHYDLDRYRYDAMTFECHINVLKVVPNSVVKRLQPYAYYDDNYSQNKQADVSNELYSYECMYDIELNNTLRFVWNIHNINGVIDRLTSYGKYKGIVQYHSDIFYDLFQLRVCRENDENRFMICICGLPKNTHKMGVKIELFAQATECNDDRMKIMSSIITFSYLSPTFILSKNRSDVLMDLLVSYHELSLLCTAHIIQKYDYENNTICAQMKRVFADECDDDRYNKENKVHIDHDNDTIDLERIRQQIIESKEKIIDLKYDVFIWHITQDSDNGLLAKLRACIANKEHQIFNSDIFELLGNKWYISIDTKNNEDQYGHRRSRRNRNTHNNEDKETVSIYVNCLAKGAIHCKVCYYVLQTGGKAQFYDSFDGNWRNRYSDAKSVLSQYSNVMKTLKEITIKTEIAIICDNGGKNEENKMDENEVHMNEEVIRWICDTVQLPQYKEAFQREAIQDLEIVKRLTMDALNLMGIHKIGHQLKILHHVDLLKQKKVATD